MADILARPVRPDPAAVAATGRDGMISTSHPAATEAGLAALRSGGSAVDAYLAAAAVQTVVEPTMTTLAGGLVVSVYDPSTGDSTLVAGVGTPPADETGDLDEAARGSGRTVVTPGWVHGADAASERWGRLDWPVLFEHALVAARDGFVVDRLLAGWMAEYRGVAGRYETGREIWFPGGTPAGEGDLLRQPALARTIEALAAEGPEYFATGDFARNYVETARAAGGRITLDDLAAAAAVELALPALPVVGGYQLHTNGMLYALMLSVASIGGLHTRDRPEDDPETLYLLLRTVEECWHFGLSLVDGDLRLPTADEMVSAVSAENAEKLWRQVESGPPRPFDAMNMGTNAIVAVDSTGMVAHGTHSASSTAFGVGLVVDGVIVPRPITLYAVPKVPIPLGWATSLLAVRDGRPVYAAGSPSISAVQNVFQNTWNVVERGMDPSDSVNRPMFGASRYPSRRPMVEATMGADVLAEVERRGIGLTPVSPWEPELGSCQAVRIDADGTLRGAADPRRLGRAAGY